MKIISKYKDYYDYLTGIYGIDNNLVLDRRVGDTIPYLHEGFRLYVAGWIVEGYYDKDSEKCYYGKALEEYGNPDIKALHYLPSKHWNRDYSKSIFMGKGLLGYWLYTKCIKDKDNINVQENCPIIYVHNKEYIRFPQLSKLDLASFVKPEIIYTWIEQWLSARITEKEIHIDTRDDVTKLQSKGFNKKTSFRPKIKKI